MRTQAHRTMARRSERGTTIIEMMVALVVLAIGILAVAQLFPAGTRGQQKDRMTTSANLFAQQKLEELRSLDWADAAIVPGTYGPDSMGASKKYALTYTVATLAAPLDQVKRVDVAVNFQYLGSRTVSATTYLRR